MKTNNPWLGLRSYQEGDTIYGRTDEIAALTQCILANTQTVVYGRSGIGKTSILNAGVFPQVRKKGVFPVNIRLEHNSDPYIRQISSAISSAVASLRKDSLDENGDKVTTYEVGSIVEKVAAIGQEESLWEYFHRHEFYGADGERLIPMLLFDQFEEIFTLEKDVHKVRRFFSELGDLLNGVIPSYISEATDDYSRVSGSLDSEEGDGFDFHIDEFNVEKEQYENYLTTSDFHLVITLREDFLSYLDRESVNMPSLKQNMYFLQMLNEEQAAIVAMNPVPGLVSKDVAALIISKVVGYDDFKLDGSPEVLVDSAILSLYLERLYQRMLMEGGSVISESLVHRLDKNIIEDFYKEAITGIPSDTIDYLEDHLINYDGRRENISLTNALHIGKIEESDIKKLKERHLLRVFSYEGDLRIEYIHDILCSTIRKRRENRLIAVEQEKERRHFELQAEALRRKARIITRVLIIAIMSVILGGITVYCGFFMPVSHIYADTISRNGWTYGLYPISKAEAQYREYHIVLKKKGIFRKHYTAEEIRDGYGELTTDFDWTPYTFNRYENPDSLRVDPSVVDLFNRTCQFETIPGLRGDLPLQERGLDKDGNVLFCLNFREVSDNKCITYYTDAYGFPIRFRDSTFFFMRETFDEKGRPAIVEYFDEEGIPVKGQDGEYMIRRFYDEDDNVSGLAYLGLNGDPINSDDGYAGCDYIYENGCLVRSSYWDHAFYPCCDEDSIYVYKIQYDSHNRDIKRSFWDLDGNKGLCKDGYHSVEYEYNDYGDVTSVIYSDTLGISAPSSSGVYKWTCDYNEKGDPLKLIEFYLDSLVVEQYTYTVDDEVSEYLEYVIRDGDTTMIYRRCVEEECGTEIYEDYLDNVVVTVKFDEKHRKISQVVTDLDGVLKQTDEYCAKEVLNYEDRDSLVVYVSTFYDEKENVLGSCRVYVDSSRCKKVTLPFDENGELGRGRSEVYSDKSFSSLEMVMSLDFDRSFRDSIYNDNSYSEYKYKYIYSAKPSKVKSNSLITVKSEETSDSGQSMIVGKIFIDESNRSTYMALREDFNVVVELYDRHKGAYSYLDEDCNLISEDKPNVPSCYVRTMFFYDNNEALYNMGFRGGDMFRYYDVENQLFQLYRYDYDFDQYRLVCVPVGEIGVPEGLSDAPRRITENGNARLYYSSWFMMAMDATMYPDDPAYRQGMRRGLILGINDWYSSGNYYIDEVEIEACFDKYAETDKTIYIYNPESQQIETYEFGPGKIGVQLDSEFVVPELRFWLNSETYKLKKGHTKSCRK